MKPILRLLLIATLILSLSSAAQAQQRREQLTALMEETALKLEKSADEQERKALHDQLESYRHELGYRDAQGREVKWDVSYQHTLIARLDEQLKTPPPAGKLLPNVQAKRSWRIVARQVLTQAQTENDEYQRLRCAHFAALLMHNADIIDQLLDEWPKIDAARKALAEDAPDDLRNKLNQAVGAYGQLSRLSTRFATGNLKLGSSEAWQVRQQLQRIKTGIDVADGKVTAEEAPDPDYVPPEMNEDQLKRADQLQERLDRLNRQQSELAETLTSYLQQVRIGLEHPRARSLAITLLQHLQYATELAETLGTTGAAPADYRKAQLQQLSDSVQLIAKQDERQKAYNQIRQQHYQDRHRRNFDQLKFPPSLKAALWNVYHKADSNADSEDENQRNISRNIRGEMENVVYRAARASTKEPVQERTLAVVELRLIKALEADFAQALPVLRSFNDQSASAIWPIRSRLENIERLGRIDSDISQHETYLPLPPLLRKAFGQAASMLVDADSQNDSQARTSLIRLQNGLQLITQFHQTARPQAWFAAPMAGTAGRNIATARQAQSARLMQMIRLYVEGNNAERDALLNTMPIYRASAHLAIINKAEEEKNLHLMTVGDKLSFDPQLFRPIIERAANNLIPPLLPHLGRSADPTFAELALDLKLNEQVASAAILALQHRRRQENRPGKIDLLLNELRHTASGDVSQHVDRWRASWHANQAADAWRQQYNLTATVHAREISNRWPLSSIPLLTKEEQQ